MSQEPTEHSPADYYGYLALMGLEDDATMSGYSLAGQGLLREAIKVFGTEFDARHPGHWGEPGK